MTYDALSYSHPSRRFMRYGHKGMVATSQPLAAQAGLDMLRQGGNAVDAAIATAACLTVVEPTSNGIGGDAFALVWLDGKLHGLNASGQCPQGLSIDRLRADGHETMPQQGWMTVTVPGTPSAWAALSERFGVLPFERLFEPAIAHARDGFAIAPMLGKLWQKAAESFARTLSGPEFAPWFETFTRNGAAPEIGSVWRSPDQAATLARIAASGARDFYEGQLAEKIDAFARQFDAPLRAADLAAHRPEWVTPISTTYRDHEVWQIPPNGQGIIALMALNILKAANFAPGDECERQHALIEALKAAFVDGQMHIADPAHGPVPTDWMLSDAYARARLSDIGPTAADPQPVGMRPGGTVYLAAADGQGGMVSLIQSNYKGFGSGVVVPGTGIALHNRGREFSLDAGHPNALAPGKRPYHTIIPGFLTRGGRAVGPFGVMGGYMQPQGHLQVLSNMLDLGMNPQAALDAPRWLWQGGRRIAVEPHFPSDIAQRLARRGHAVQPQLDETGFGRGQIIQRDDATGVLAGGTDPRTDGEAAIL